VRLAVDVCIGKRGIAILEAAGHEIVVQAQHGETDRSWFRRALARGVDAVVAIDSDLEVLCYDADVRFVRARQCANDKVNAERIVTYLRRVTNRGDRP
jgi:hypothetical protein